MSHERHHLRRGSKIKKYRGSVLILQLWATFSDSPLTILGTGYTFPAWSQMCFYLLSAHSPLLAHGLTVSREQMPKHVGTFRYPSTRQTTAEIHPPPLRTPAKGGPPYHSWPSTSLYAAETNQILGESQGSDRWMWGWMGVGHTGRSRMRLKK